MAKSEKEGLAAVKVTLPLDAVPAVVGRAVHFPPV